MTPDVVVLNIVMNDIQHQPFVRKFNGGQQILFNSLDFHSFFNLHFLNRIPFFRLLNAIFNNPEGDSMSEYSYFYNLNKNSIVEMSELSNSLDAIFLAMVYPHNEVQIYGGINNEYFKFEEILRLENITYLSLFNHIYNHSEFDFFVDFSHFNPKGINLLVSEKIVPFILNNSALSSELR